MDLRNLQREIPERCDLCWMMVTDHYTNIDYCVMIGQLGGVSVPPSCPFVKLFDICKDVQAMKGVMA